MLWLVAVLGVGAAARHCVGRLYYRPDCAADALAVIAANATECGRVRTGLQSVKLETGRHTFVDVCGSQEVRHCAVVDDNHNVFVASASGTRPSGACSTAGMRFVVNLGNCAAELDRPCVNTQFFKVADCLCDGGVGLSLALLVVVAVLAVV